MRWLDKWRHRIATRRIREGMAALGSDVSDLSDAEIELGLVRLSERVAGAGLSFSEAVRVFKNLGGKRTWQNLDAELRP